MTVFRERLLLGLLRARIDVEMLASAAKVDAKWLRMLLSGRDARVPVSKFARISAALACSPDWLLGRTETYPCWRTVREAVPRKRASRVRRPERLRSVMMTTGVVRSAPPRREPARLAERLARVVNEKGVSRAELARETRVSEHVLDDFARGKVRDLTIETFSRLVEVSGHTAAWWLEIEG